MPGHDTLWVATTTEAWWRVICDGYSGTLRRYIVRMASNKAVTSLARIPKLLPEERQVLS